MPIRFRCHECQSKYAVTESFAGKTAKCKKCGTAIKIPEPDSALKQEPGREPAKPRIVAELVQPEQDHPTHTPSSSTSQAAHSTAQPSNQRQKPITVKVVASASSVAENKALDSVPMESHPLPSISPVARDRQANDAEHVQPAVLPHASYASEAELLAAISGPIEAVPTTLSYRFAAVLVAFLMILLPMIYIGIICLSIVGVFYYAIHGTAIFQTETRSSRGGAGLFLLYIGPLLIGIVTVLFMIKPLFARSSSAERRRSLTRKHEPKLFAFVDRLCESVHAPKPKRIDVDCDVNASASFRRGLLSMLFSGDLVLTIGMPLVAGLSTRQLAGVLAHEFGHFSQGFGMRVSYVVRTISYWFARVVYERDAWDDWLARTANSIDLRVGIVLHLARLMIWLTRRILWLLMMVGNLFSCYLLRQMEFDADLHEIRFSGSDNFRKTSMQLRRLGVGYQQAMMDQQGFFMDGTIGDNMPKLTAFNRDEQDETLVRKIFEGVLEEKTEWFTTHPVDKDRVARAKEENEAGVFQLELPASSLFENYEAICKGVTNDLFKSIFEEDFKPNMLVPIEDLMTHKQASREANLAMRRMFGNYFNVPRQMSFATNFQSPADRNQTIRQLQSSRQQMIDLLPAYVELSQQFDKQDSRWVTCHQVISLLELGVKLKEKDFEVPVSSKQATYDASEDCRSRLAAMNPQLQPLETAFVARVKAVGDLLHDPAMRQELGNQADELIARLRVLIQTLPIVLHSYADVVKLRNEFAALSLMLRIIGGQEVSNEIIANVKSRVEKLVTHLHVFSDRFAAVDFPFEHADGRISLTKYMVPSVPTSDQIGETLGAAEKLLDNYHYVYFRSIGGLAETCQRVEEQLGMPPQADPPELPPEEEDDDDA